MGFAGIFQKDEADTKDLTFGERILLMLEYQKKSKTWLADQIGLSKQAVNYLLKHSSTPRYVNEIAAALEISPEWLLTGKKSFQILEEQAGICRIPILATEDIPVFLKNRSSDLTNDFTHVTQRADSASCFATKLENSSMEPLFHQGTLLIFNSELKPKNGDFIIYNNKKDKEVFFRQYFIDGKDIYLKAIDTMFNNFKSTEIVTLGVLIESRNIFK